MIENFGARTDVDIAMTWQIENLGYGTGARRNASHSRFHQSQLQVQKVHDQIAEQVTTTYVQTKRYRNTLPIKEANIQQASEALKRNLDAIRALAGQPLESVSSLSSLFQARQEYLEAIVEYNQWQLRMIRAVQMSLAEISMLPDAGQ